MRPRRLLAPLFAAAFAFCALAAPPVEIVSPTIQDGAPPSSDQGYITLRWLPLDSPPPEGTTYELQQADNPGFRDPITRYAGADLGSVLTGFAEGDYYFRVRAVSPDGQSEGPWSENLPFSVAYMPMSRVWLFLATGAVVFILTLGAIVAGHRRARQENNQVEGSA